MPPPSFPTLAVFGGGNMAQAIIRGGLDAHILNPARITVCEPDEPKRRLFESLHIRATANHADAIQRAEVILLAVKPQSLPQLADQLRPLLAALTTDPLIISILAGATTAAISSALDYTSPIIRVMPNTPAQIGEAMSAYCLGFGTTISDAAFVHFLFAAIGKVVRIDESLMDAFTALSGSGPAYLFYLAEAMTRAALELGFDAPTADTIVRQVLRGSSRLLSESPLTPDQLRASVTSKGGTTAAAIDVLDKASVQSSFITAIRAARDRGRELAR